MNKVTITGNAVKDVIVVEKNNKYYMALRVAVNSLYASKEHTDYYDCLKIFKEKPKFSIKKGEKVIVHGNLNLICRTYKGEDYHELKVIADVMEAAQTGKAPF